MPGRTLTSCDFYDLPEKLLEESNADFCRRAANSIPPEALLRQLVDHLMTRKKNCRGWLRGEGDWDSAWSFVSQFTGHGSGVAGAIVQRFSEIEPAPSEV